MEWWKKLDELNEKGYDVTDRLVMPNKMCCVAYPAHWTTEQMVNEAYAYVANLERECPNLVWTEKQTGAKQ